MTYNFTAKQFKKHLEEIEDIYNLCYLIRYYSQSNNYSEDIYRIFAAIKIVTNKLSNLIVLLNDIEYKHSEHK